MLRKLIVIPAAISVSIAAALGSTAPAQAQEPFVAQMMVFGGDFCPTGWARAEGQLLSISSNTALFSLLGTSYGGNGTTNFALPDLRGRAVLGSGQGPALPEYFIGEQGGAESFILDVTELPSHTHIVQATTTTADKSGPLNKYLGVSVDNQYSVSTPNVNMAADMVAPAGSGIPVPYREPFLTTTWCIALQGVFPQRP